MLKLLPLLLITVLCSCHTTRTITTAHTNTDSLVTHVRDSMSQVNRSIEQKYQQRIQELVNSSVVFETQPCPDMTPLREMLDSIGRVNFDLVMHKDSMIKALQNKVTVSANGAITAQGNVRSVTVSNNKLMEENRSLTERLDSMGRVLDSDRVALSKKVDEKVKVVTKTVIPIWIWLLMAAIGVAGYGVAWWRRHGRLV